MKTFVMLLRGINVGGRNKLLMKQLVDILEKLGCQNVKTYIQSGNVVFQGDNLITSKLSEQISHEIYLMHNFKPDVLILTGKDFHQAIKVSPYPEAEPDPKTLHLGFLGSVPEDANLDKLDSLKKTSERFRLINKVFYLHAPDGIGRSKLAAQSEKAISVSMTSRNWRTVCKLQEMVVELEQPEGYKAT